MMIKVSFGVLLLTSFYFEYSMADVINKDAPRTMGDLIRENGYPVEEYKEVQTPDGYLLTLFRIPYGKESHAQQNKPVVFLMHGLFCSSAVFVTSGPLKSLGFILADAGYDVWLGNARGNMYSRKHISLNPDKDSAFWKFSWHEIGVTDLPTMIDFVLQTTNQRKLYYAGHSQGTTSFFVMGSERPEYSEKVQLMVALAPVAYMSHAQNPLLRLLSPLGGVIGFGAKLLGIDEVSPSNELLQLLGQTACNDQSLIQEVCSSLLFLMYGWNSEQLNRSMIPSILAATTPSGASTMQVLHYAQEVQSGKFCQYDYGLFGNPGKYKFGKPPDYRTSNITAPIALLYGQNDWLAAVVDVKKLAGELPNLVTAYSIPHRKFNHLDFLYAINAKELVYDYVVSLFKDHPIF